MKYKVKERFYDRVLGMVFEAGDTYPPNDTSVESGWVEQLASSNNAEQRPFLELAEAPKEPEKQDKPAPRGRPRKQDS